MRRRALLALGPTLAAAGLQRARAAAGAGAQEGRERQAVRRGAAAPDVLVVEGAVRRPLRLDRAALAERPEAEQGRATVTRRIDGDERSTTVRGVRLAALLDAAGLDERDRLDWRQSVVLASGADGYRVVFSWPELVNTEGGGQVLVVHERDGAPLDAREGPIALHAPGDLRSGPRHVRQLVRLEVRILRD